MKKKLFQLFLQFVIGWAILSSVPVQHGCSDASMGVEAGWQHLVGHIRECCGSVKSVLLLDVVHVLAPLKLNRLASLDMLCKLSLNRGGLDVDGLRRACTSHHLGSDHLKLLRVQLNWNLVDLPSGRDDRLENLDSSWRSCCCTWLLHLMVWLSLLLLLLLGLELDHLGLWLLLLMLLELELKYLGLLLRLGLTLWLLSLGGKAIVLLELLLLLMLLRQ